MHVLAQAAAEYGGLTTRTVARGPLDGLLDRLVNASPGELVLLVGGALVALYVVLKLLDAA